MVNTSGKTLMITVENIWRR